MEEKRISEKKASQGQVANTDLNQGKLGADSTPPSSLSRREFLGSVGGVTAITMAAGVVGLPPLSGTKSAEANEIGPTTGEQRASQAFQIRHQAALTQLDPPFPDHPCNGDEELFPNKIGNYSKGLPHDSPGEVDLNAYNSLIQALSTGNLASFETILLAGDRKLVNPQAGLAFDLEGDNSHKFVIRPAPAFHGAEEAGEAVELYWQALARNVPLTEYDTNPTTNAAAADLSRLSGFRRPQENGQVTTRTLFRGFTPGDFVGPYVSQFLLKPVPCGAEIFEQRILTLRPGLDYLTQYSDWLNVQNGFLPQLAKDPFDPKVIDPTPRFIRNGRDLVAYVRVDVLFQAYFNAMLILLGMGAPPNPGNPYNNSRTQVGFGTFGPPHFATLVCEMGSRALKAVWFQKWFVHRRLRPEEFGGHVHNHVTGAANYPIHPDLLNSQALGKVFSKFGSFLLPQAYPDGCPLHPAYGAGHATVAGACVTILKALFDETFLIPEPLVPTPDGRRLVPLGGPPLMVGGELNKLAANVAIGRNFAGIHWRTDYSESLLLGEAIAINIFRDQKATYHESFGGFTFTKFDGTTITI